MSETPKYIATLWGQKGPEVVGYSDEGDDLDGFKKKLDDAFAAQQAIPTYVIWSRMGALAARDAEILALRNELDDASPLTKCSRCKHEFRMHTLIPQEGDEWECATCFERENARERTAIRVKNHDRICDD